MVSIARLDGVPPVEITLRRSARARRYALRVSRVDGRVTLTLPLRAPAGEALAFARAHEHWIRARLAEMPRAHRVVPGGLVPVAGADRVITAARVSRPRLEGDLLLIPEPVLARAGAGPGVAASLSLMARERIEPLCESHAAAIGRRYSAVVLRDTRSRWGSCSAAGRLMFSWRLIMAPPEVLDYVAAHEVAHLAEMNHSAAFWDHVARLMPGFRAQRDWLRRHGPSLHRVDFSR